MPHCEDSPRKFFHNAKNPSIAQQAASSEQSPRTQEALVHRCDCPQDVLQNGAPNQRVLDGCRKG